jgi:two-component system CheB/CheR fusion protein
VSPERLARFFTRLGDSYAIMKSLRDLCVFTRHDLINVDAAESLQLALEMEGHEVTVAHDGPSGLARARRLVPDVVLCDIGLPGMDGYAVAKALRCEPALRDTFIVALTGHALPDDQGCASEAGFDAHLTKSATIARIQEVIGRARRGPPPRADRPVRSPSLAVS